MDCTAIIRPKRGFRLLLHSRSENKRCSRNILLADRQNDLAAKMEPGLFRLYDELYRCSKCTGTIKNFVHLCEKHDMLCNSFQLSSGYTSIGDKRYVFNWDKNKIPSPKEMVQHFHEKDVRLCANIKPCLLKDHPKFDELKEKEMFIVNRETQNRKWPNFGMISEPI